MDVVSKQAEQNQQQLQKIEEDDEYKKQFYPKLKMRKMQSLIRDFHMIEQQTGIITISIVNLLNIQNAENILECGCGCEYSLPYICGIKKQSSPLYMTDFSEVKLRKIKQKVQLLEDHPLSQELYDHKYVPDEEFTEKYISEKLNITVEIADATHLQYPANMFDSYYGGLLLDEVEEPFRIVLEAHRVLKKGGRAGFTVISEKTEREYEVYKIIEKAYWKVQEEESQKENITEEIFLQKKKKESIEIFGDIDSFEMEIYQYGFKAKIQQILQRANFQNILIWESFIPVQCLDFQHLYDCFEIYTRDLKMDQDIHQRVFEASKEEFQKSINLTNKPFGFTVICAVAQKL